MSKLIFDRYADAVIGTKTGDFNAIEIHGVRNVYGKENEEGAVRDNEHPDFFSVFLRYKEGNSQRGEGVQCAGDFSLRNDAINYASELKFKYDWPVYNYTTADAKPMRPWQRMSDEALLDAAKLNDLDDAARHVQDIAGINDGGIAGRTLEHLRDDWPTMKPTARVSALENWRDTEEGADLDYAPPAPEHLDLTLILAGLRCLQEYRSTLSEGIIDILAKDNISAETADDRAQLTEDIDNLCERINSTDTIITSKSIISNLLPYARSRAEDMMESEGSPEQKQVALDACAAVDAGYKAICEKP
jgi:hypothetical protein